MTVAELEVACGVEDADAVPLDDAVGAVDAVDAVDAADAVFAVDEGLAEESVTPTNKQSCLANVSAWAKSLGLVQAALMHASWVAINCWLRQRQASSVLAQPKVLVV